MPSRSYKNNIKPLFKCLEKILTKTKSKFLIFKQVSKSINKDLKEKNIKSTIILHKYKNLKSYSNSKSKNPSLKNLIKQTSSLKTKTLSTQLISHLNLKQFKKNKFHKENYHLIKRENKNIHSLETLQIIIILVQSLLNLYNLKRLLHIMKKHCKINKILSPKINCIKTVIL
jgi:hypothetical protein